MKGGYYTDAQFNHILEVLILYKKCCPEREVSLSEASIRSAVKHFQSTGMFEALSNLSEPDSDVTLDKERETGCQD
jgi:hypothetical protein